MSALPAFDHITIMVPSLAQVATASDDGIVLLRALAQQVLTSAKERFGLIAVNPTAALLARL